MQFNLAVSLRSKLCIKIKIVFLRSKDGVLEFNLPLSLWSQMCIEIKIRAKSLLFNECKIKLSFEDQNLKF